jgi:sterol desaturase/sphingolipid hydroxylase (fatty acid hydroxylase superfamily)
MANEPLIRFLAFAGLFVLLAAWEVLAPRRPHALPRRRRWPANLGIVVLNTALVRLAFPLGAAGFALLCEQRGWGLMNMFELPEWLAVAVAVLLLDLALYLQHALFHGVPLLWRLHRMHHADLELDFTTGTRFHTLEIVLSLAIKLAVIALLGVPALAVLIFDVLLNGTSMFNHANLAMPAGLDRLLRRIVVTPDMHRVHHSIHRDETDSNFGFNLPWWDRLFGTYRPEPRDGHLGMTLGIPRFRDPGEQRLDRMLMQPFRR